MVMYMMLMGIALLLGLWMIPAAVMVAAAPYVYGTVLVLFFWALRTEVRKFAFD